MGTFVRSDELGGYSSGMGRWSKPAIWVAIGVVLGLLLAVVVGSATTILRPTAPPKVVTVTLPHGASRLEAGVPVGYEHTKQGSIDAATNYAVALNGPVLLHQDDIRKVEAAIIAQSYRDQAKQQDDQALQGLNSAYGLDADQRNGIDVHMQLVPIAYHLDAYNDESVRVSIWSVWVVAANGVLAPRQNWTTSMVGLTWENGDWKVFAWGARPGPVPQPPQGVVSEQSSPLPDEITSYQRYQHVSG